MPIAAEVDLLNRIVTQNTAQHGRLGFVVGVEIPPVAAAGGAAAIPGDDHRAFIFGRHQTVKPAVTPGEKAKKDRNVYLVQTVEGSRFIVVKDSKMITPARLAETLCFSQGMNGNKLGIFADPGSIGELRLINGSGIATISEKGINDELIQQYTRDRVTDSGILLARATMPLAQTIAQYNIDHVADPFSFGPAPVVAGGVVAPGPVAAALGGMFP
jgi:hypothetical protein